MAKPALSGVDAMIIGAIDGDPCPHQAQLGLLVVVHGQLDGGDGEGDLQDGGGRCMRWATRRESAVT